PRCRRPGTSKPRASLPRRPRKTWSAQRLPEKVDQEDGRSRHCRVDGALTAPPFRGEPRGTTNDGSYLAVSGLQRISVRISIIGTSRCGQTYRRRVRLWELCTASFP